jgi:hypothetical protein
MNNGKLVHRVFVGVVPEPEEQVYFVFENGDGVLLENNDKVIA